MFTWVCPKCGAEVDVTEKQCPRCEAALDVESTDDTADNLPRLKETPDPEPPQEQRDAFQLKPTHMAIFVVALIAAIGAAVYFSQSDRLALEDIPDDAIADPIVTGGSGIAGPIEVTGLRFRYDEDLTPLAQALVINHSNRELYAVELEVRLNTVEAPAGAMPLASFNVVLDEPLEAQASVEVEQEMLMAGTIQALPPTDLLRVEVERLN